MHGRAPVVGQKPQQASTLQCNSCLAPQSFNPCDLKSKLCQIRLTLDSPPAATLSLVKGSVRVQISGTSIGLASPLSHCVQFTARVYLWAFAGSQRSHYLFFLSQWFVNLLVFDWGIVEHWQGVQREQGLLWHSILLMSRCYCADHRQAQITLDLQVRELFTGQTDLHLSRMSFAGSSYFFHGSCLQQALHKTSCAVTY